MPEFTSEQPAGRRLGRYIVRRRIGAGGFARVYLGWDPDLEIEVAIKIPKPQLAEDEGALERFRREATTAARLRHPNVVTVLTVGRIEERFDGAPTDTPYLVMDYLPESLATRLGESTALPEPEWLRIGAEVARGLAYAHGRSVIHRDIKPDNILFGRHGEAVLTDFGIARAVVEGMAPASRSIVVGTPEYFSPEQARGLAFDARTDVYGLGVTLYRAATGALPFTGPDWYAIMRQHVEDAPPPPQSVAPTVSDEASRIILRCLAKAPDDRYQTAEALVADLEAAERRLTAPVVASTQTVELRPAAVARPRRRAWALAGLALVGAAGATAWLAFQNRTGQATPATTAADSTAGADTATTPSPVVTTPTDSVVAPASESTGVPIVAVRASLRVTATDGAVISLDGRRVGVTTWESDSLRIGRHELRAQVASLPGCPTAIATATVDLRGGARRTVALAPVPCGALSLADVSPQLAHYTLRGGPPGTPRAEGTAPTNAPLVLPAGLYQLGIIKTYCIPFGDSVRITAGDTIRKVVRLYCDGR